MAQHVIPRYRGFNLLDLFSTSNRWDEHFPMSHGHFAESDFQWMSKWGFDFARIPMSYLYFVNNEERDTFNEKQLSYLDEVIRLGEKYGIHVCLSFHRAAGYCITEYPFDLRERGNLWKDKEDLELFKLHWSILAKRYKGIGSDRLSFDLINEPPIIVDKDNKGNDPYTTVTWEDYVKVHKGTAETIHGIDPERLIIIDGGDIGNSPCLEMANMKNIAQSCRGYSPSLLTHYRCPWNKPNRNSALDVRWPWRPEYAPDETGIISDSEVPEYLETWDDGRFREMYRPWFDLADKGTGVHMGECGCYRSTPHKAVLSWFESLLSLMKEHNIGFALWNFRGSFGILDSGRKDVAYKDWNGHLLDRELLDILRKY